MDLSRALYFLSAILVLGCVATAVPHHGGSNEECPKCDSFAEVHRDDEDARYDDPGHDDHDTGGRNETYDIDGNGNGHNHEDCMTTSYDFDGEWYYETMQKCPELKDFTLAATVTTDGNGMISGPIFNIHSAEQSFTVHGRMQDSIGYLTITFSGQQRDVMTSFSPNTDYHIAVVVNVTSNSVYVLIGGELLKQIIFSSITSALTNGRITIGYAVGEDYKPYQGKLQNLMLWNRMLTDMEIDEIHENNHCIHDPVLILHEHNMVPQKYGVPTVACPKIEYTFNNTGDRVEYTEIYATIPRLEFATACTTITTDARGIIPGTSASYGTKDEPESLSVTGFMNSKGEAKNVFVIQGQKFIRPGQFGPNTKYQMCIVYHYKHNHLRTYINNYLTTVIQYKGMGYLPGGGRVIFGQRQQKLGRCFNYPYVGTMEDFMYWGRVLSQEEIRGYSEGRCPMDQIF